MTVRNPKQLELLSQLDETVTRLNGCFATLARNNSDGKETAFAVLARLVFWHDQYVHILRDITEGRTPELLIGSFDMLNSRARIKYANHSMLSLVLKLKELHTELRELLLTLPDWTINFPVKFDSSPMNVEARVEEITSVFAAHEKHFRVCKEA